MITNQPSDPIYTTVAEHLESDHPVTLDELQRIVIQEHINEWSHEDCFNLLEQSPRINVDEDVGMLELGEYDDVPSFIDTESDTAVERRLRYHTAIETVEQILDTYEDPVRNHDLRLHG